MADSDIKVSQLSHGTVALGSLFYMANGDDSEYCLSSDLGNFANTSQNFAGLNTTSKTVVGAINEVMPTKLTGTLTAGSTTITISDASITTSSDVLVMTDPEIWHNSTTLAAGSVTITFDAQASDVEVGVILL